MGCLHQLGTVAIIMHRHLGIPGLISLFRACSCGLKEYKKGTSFQGDGHCLSLLNLVDQVI